MPNRPLVAMEVFDVISEKYPPVLRDIYDDLLNDPPQMAKVCIEKYGADLISVRLEGTHPEKGNRTPEQAAQLVKQVLSAVEVPIIVTGHSYYDSINEVMKTVSQACAGENLLLNWVERKRFYEITRSSLEEIDTQLEISLNLKFCTNEDLTPISDQMNYILAMLSRMVTKTR